MSHNDGAVVDFCTASNFTQNDCVVMFLIIAAVISLTLSSHTQAEYVLDWNLCTRFTKFKISTISCGFYLVESYMIVVSIRDVFNSFESCSPIITYSFFPGHIQEY
ncbi:hypothetical protein CHS0354_011881 [Potamilus streckersoni]|uniref:Uncharacterized protein n=1 Tax=Potamilus streckersoni TaxID=2493646 RepID=A0AAE0T6Z3_9BIVA|nr:hypothetical protein CHS0354_011881 [Potamilus streckersoni]